MAYLTKPFRRRSGARSLAALSAAALITVASAAQADSAASAQNGDTAPGAAAMGFDLVLARPVGLAATVLGTGIFIIGLPFEALSGDFADPARRLITEPAKFTFTRKLGVMEGE